MNAMLTTFLRLLRLVFSNNGIARGLIYWSIGVFTPWPPVLMEWDANPPKTWYVIFATVISSALAGLVALRAYMDQHLSKPATQDGKSEKVS